MRIDIFLVIMLIISGIMFFTISPFWVMSIIFIIITLCILFMAIGRNKGIFDAVSKSAKKSNS